MVKPSVQLFLDAADLKSLHQRYVHTVEGFTTNPTLMAQAGLIDYDLFVVEMLHTARGKPVSFEVIADDLAQMQAQARWLAAQGSNVYVKIPITNSVGVSCLSLIQHLSADGIAVNVTAVMTPAQIEQALPALSARAILSIFAGRIADTGRNPIPFLKYAIRQAQGTNTQILWASPREVYNVTQATEIGCDIITLTPALLDKLSLQGKDLTQYSLETVQMFRRDALAAGLDCPLSIK